MPITTLAKVSISGQREQQELVDSGPYRWIRHPIYSAYLLNYFGGGLLAASWVLLFIPGTLFMIMVSLRFPEEEQTMIDLFGDRYKAYRKHTGLISPKGFPLPGQARPTAPERRRNCHR